VTNKNDSIYKLMTSNKISKKVFMSATPKIYNIKSEDDVQEYNVDYFKDIFGEIAYSYSFLDAIKNKYINDYRLIIPNINTENNKYEFIYNNMLYYGYRKCLIYSQDLKECQRTVDELVKINKNNYNFEIMID